MLSANLNDPTAVAASLQLLGLNNLDDVRLLDFEEQSELRIALRGAEILLGDRSRLRRMLNEDQESASTRVFEAVELKRPISRDCKQRSRTVNHFRWTRWVRNTIYYMTCTTTPQDLLLSFTFSKTVLSLITSVDYVAILITAITGTVG